MGSCGSQRSRPQQQQQQQQQAGRPGPVQGSKACSKACSKAGRGLSSSRQTRAEAQSRQGHGERAHAPRRLARGEAWGP